MNCPIVGVAVDDWTTKDLRDHARKAIRGTGEKIDSKIFDRFANRLSYVQGDFADDETYERVADHIKGAKRPVFYLEIPPSLFEMVVQGAVGAGLTDNARVVVEKPFGHELESARALAAELQVLLHAAMQGDSTCFTRQDNIEQTWRIVKPCRRPWGPTTPGSGDGKRAAGAEAGVQSAAAPSPFPPIADYAFISNCQPAPSLRPMGRSTGCACRASTRRASSGRCSTARPEAFCFAPFGLNVPTTRAYEPGTNVLVLEHTEPLGHRSRRADDGPAARRGHDHAAHEAPGRSGRGSRAGAHRPLPRGQRGDGADLRAGLRLRPHAGRVVAGRRGSSRRGRDRRGRDGEAADRHGAGHRGQLGPGAPHPRGGRPDLLRTVLGRGV